MFRAISSASPAFWRHQRLYRNARWMASASAASSIFEKVTFIGTGKMAQAMIDPLITNGYQPAEKVSVYDLSSESMEALKSKFPGIQTSVSIGEAVHDAECIVLAVKPQNINESFWAEFPPTKSGSKDDQAGFNLREDATLVSILAGM